MEIIQRLKQGMEDDRYSFDKFFVELNEFADHIHPLTNAPEPKSNFLPSKWEAKRVRRLAQAIRNGDIKLDKAKKEAPKAFLIWDENKTAEESAFLTRHIPPPKPPLPGHAESYNPPEEYLFDEQEKQAWEMLDAEDRSISCIPQKNSSLRTTPAYRDFHKERFQRCLDLYLATRVKKKRAWIDPSTLVPKVPKPSELRPFPSQMSTIYRGHEGYVRSIDTDATGQWLVSGSDDYTVRVWEVHNLR
jgi:ribosome biogenesis protein ERB1